MFFDPNRSKLSYIRRNTVYLRVLFVTVLSIMIIGAIALNQNEKRILKMEKELIELNKIVKEGWFEVI